ncbi:High-affnity carbon uptake protein Hat/HatR [uncultured Coleofasciculus sp.]|uniref:High-affnity carbon uptake protein Hat/HatR n=1 Tax=uncultured Coleofasciculus sp. TaxID=1267456 RepID=A0A6J4J4T0_9CYAN|nr:High-affnity carbon uptake protein Hat/HatR [uncultured Coleofasciculus sp.]
MTTWTDSGIRQTSLEEQQLYDHLLYCVQVESASQLIERFQRLFLDGARYVDPQIWLALEKVAMDKRAEQEFKFVLNRCCHILINRWQLQPHLQGSIQELVGLFENPPDPMKVQSRGARRLRQLVQLFTETEQYVTLQRLSRVMSESSESNGSRQVGTLIQRYPYLYEHCLLSEDSSYEHQQTVRQIQSRVQRRMEFDLSQYVTYQVRRAQAMRSPLPEVQERIIHPVRNPTLLSDRELGIALKQFVGKVQGPHTYRDVAQSFQTHTKQTASYKEFKNDLYEYLIASIDPAYGKRQFNERLYTLLKNTLPHSEAQKPTEFLIVRTCSQLLNFLVVESPQRPNHFTFVDLITNLGATLTTGLLLKIVLLCRKVKPYLEKRFSILFNHYESSTRDGVPWLVTSLENLNIAFSVHFGAADLSCLNQIM